MAPHFGIGHIRLQIFQLAVVPGAILFRRENQSEEEG